MDRALAQSLCSHNLNKLGMRIAATLARTTGAARMRSITQSNGVSVYWFRNAVSNGSDEVAEVSVIIPSPVIEQLDVLLQLPPIALVSSTT